MKLYYLHVENEPGVRSSLTTWLVLADSLLEAVSIVPENVALKAVVVQSGNAVDTRRVLMPMNRPAAH